MTDTCDRGTVTYNLTMYVLTLCCPCLTSQAGRELLSDEQIANSGRLDPFKIIIVCRLIRLKLELERQLNSKRVWFLPYMSKRVFTGWKPLFLYGYIAIS